MVADSKIIGDKEIEINHSTEETIIIPTINTLTIKNKIKTTIITTNKNINNNHVGETIKR